MRQGDVADGYVVPGSLITRRLGRSLHCLGKDMSCSASTTEGPHTSAAATNAASYGPSASKTLYELLGVSSTAGAAEIKAAYRQLAMLYHPDVNPTDVARHKFLVIQQAYEVLSSIEMRLSYDKFGVKGILPKFQALKDYFLKGPGAATSSKKGQKGRDVYTVVGLDLKEAVTGVEKVVKVAVHGVCIECEGTGIELGCGDACEVCHGSGEILRSAWSGHVKTMRLGVCPACGGTGVESVSVCCRCKGEGRARVQRGIKVKVPAGVDETSMMRLRHMGDCGRNGGLMGDLYVKFRVHPAENMQRQGQDLYSQLEVDVFDAVLGASVSVQTVRGQQLLDIPAGTQHGDTVKLAQAGVARAQGGVTKFGDHFFTVVLRMPNASSMNECELALLRQAAKARAAAEAAANGSGGSFSYA